MTEHWVDVAIRERRSIVLEGNVPRISAGTLVKLNELKNQLTGRRISLYEADQIAREKNEQVI